MVQYERIYDHVTLPLDPSVKQLDCIFSFQEHKYGNFVVIRNNFIKTNTAINADGLQSQQWLRFGYNFYSRRTGDFIRSYESFAGELEKLPLKERYEILEKAFQVDEPKWAAPAGSFKKLAALFSAN